MTGALTASTLEKLKQLRSSGVLAKANTVGILQATGLVNFDLEEYAKILVPVITPIRNSIPRAKGRGDTATHWRAITAINPGRTFPGASEGNRGAYIDQTEADKVQSYKRLSLENFVTEEAILAAEGFDNALAIGQDVLLWASMVAEEEVILTGNSTQALGTPAQPTGADSGAVTGGTLANVAYKCRVVALTYDGYRRASVAGGLKTTFTKSNADGSSDTVNGGSSIASTGSAAVTPVAAHSITWKVTAIPGAFAYAWFTDVSANDPNELLAGITTINQFVQTAPATGTQLASVFSADKTTNGLLFDGLIIQALQGNGYYKSLDGATLTADGAGGIVEIDAALQAFYDSFKVTPTKMWVSTQEARNITKKVLAGGSTPIFRITEGNGPGQGSMQAGTLVTSYLNKFSPYGMQNLPIEIHPNILAGKIFFDCDNVPYPLANIPGARRMKARREYWSVLWPQTTMQRQFSVNVDELLQVYTPFAMGVLDNILDG